MITFEIIGLDGVGQRLTGNAGDKIRDLAVAANNAGIIGECGGFMACGTCHVIVDDEWAVQVGVAEGDEAFILDGTLSRHRYSRLACQMRLSENLDGLVVRIPHA